MTIRRFDNDEGASEMYECEDGTFVTYEEHLAIVQKLKAEIDKVWTQGYLEGLMGED